MPDRPENQHLKSVGTEHSFAHPVDAGFFGQRQPRLP